MNVFQISLSLNHESYHVCVLLNQCLEKVDDNYNTVYTYEVKGHIKATEFVKTCLKQLPPMSPDDLLIAGILLRSLLPLNGAKNVKVVIMPINPIKSALKFLERSPISRELLNNNKKFSLKDKDIKLIQADKSI